MRIAANSKGQNGVNPPGNHPAKRSVKDIVWFLEASPNDEFVLTCGTVLIPILERLK